MTCTPTSSPTRRAAAAPASVAALTEPTSPRTMAVTSPASTFCHPTKTTFAALTIASAASIIPIRPRVSTRPSASPGGSFAMGAPFYLIGALRDPAAGGHRQPFDDGVAVDQPHGIHHVRHHAR